MRCFKFFLRGMLCLEPTPFHTDYRCWRKGADATTIAIVASVPLIIFGAGVLVGRWLS